MTGARFGRRARLVAKRDFRRVFARPRKSGDRFFTVLARPNDRGQARLGLAVSRKVSRSAVARNRIKRIVRESFRHHRHALGAVDCVVIGRPGVSRVDNATLFEALERHWGRLVKRCASS